MTAALAGPGPAAFPHRVAGPASAARRVRTCADLVPAFRAARNDTERRELCLEVLAAAFPALAAALWAEHHARRAADDARTARRDAMRAGTPPPSSRAIADQMEAVARVHTLLWDLPGAGAQRLDGALDLFDPTPARKA